MRPLARCHAGEQVARQIGDELQQDVLDRLRRLRERQVVGPAERQRRLDRRLDDRDSQDGDDATTSRAMDSGRIVAPRPSAMTAMSVPADSISATTRGAMPMPAQASSTILRTTLYGRGRYRSMSAISLSGTVSGGGSMAAGPTRQSRSLRRGWKARPWTVVLPP